MKSIKFILLLAFMGFYVFNGNSQTSNKKSEYVIQVATYSNMGLFNKHIQALTPLQKHGMVVRMQPTRVVYAYLLDTYGNFTNKEKANQRLKTIKKIKGFKTAFVKTVQSDYSRAEDLASILSSQEAASVRLKNRIIPEEFSTKGGRIANFRIQLGCFGSVKTADQIASTYNLSNYEKVNINKFVSDDFTNVNGDICRRYYYGNFASKAAAEKRKAAMEKSSGVKLRIVSK